MRLLIAFTLFFGSLLVTTSAQAQFGQAGAVESTGTLTPGVDMPLFGVYNRVNRDTDAPSTISLATTRSSIVQIFMENVAPSSSTGLQDTEIGSATMLPATAADPSPTLYPSTSLGAPAHTDTRTNRVYVREVYNDMAIVWNFPPLSVITAPNTSYDLCVLVSWPAGVGQAFGTHYPAGSAVLKIRYDAVP